MRDAAHFRAWLQASDRQFITFLSQDLIDSLSFAPENMEIFQQIVHCYRQHRSQIQYDVRRELDQISGEMIPVPVCKDDRLTLAEKDRLVRKLVGELKDAVEGWSLDGEPIG